MTVSLSPKLMATIQQQYQYNEQMLLLKLKEANKLSHYLGLSRLELIAFFLKFATHQEDCEVATNTRLGISPECTCGFQEASDIIDNILHFKEEPMRSSSDG